MKSFTLSTLFLGLAMTAPLTEALVARAVTSAKTSSTLKSSIKVSSTSVKASSTAGSGTLLGVNVGGSSSPLLGVSVGTATVLAVDVSAAKATSMPKITSTPKASSTPTVKASSGSVKVIAAASSSAPVKSASMVSSAKAVSTITVAPTTTLANPTALPSTFSAPVQGQGTLTLDNLPALPGVIDKTFSGVLGSVYGLMSGACNQDYKCSIYVAGTIQSLLVDGGNYTGSSTVSAWCDAGRCYGSANPTVTATSPFIITCDANSACSAVISGAATAIFTNGQQVALWGWITPAGYCQNGVCTASIKAFGDPMY
ncbi:hypothetical protein HBI56_183020 [Parastagonospora nodorum]|uniref:Uncharacterized protein n=1 Tax=Phaeosphaeria nodorum (strain SN15 / ATCC MYA-4574 / FGSC 10173) TaxID=321614 RepID=A0A7U2I7X2_PHANO|nr:hypothetical protein HBH56_191500 [Parastagonospora nodorum]QRD03108.1 hypothetical protein JI435_141270 [Parastagonospora nodorum SN15]KAH3937799.1 hypothetical protein HBH54_010500 [Parastagonospora nodorum]KAH3940812.1 hypothetical protein HBH53_211840 [Parastagonospora nodorum]KAH3977863.1 hypothetical protein HBH51_072280 [Parastagonospora nodorum]